MCNKKSIKEIKYNTKKKTTSYKEQCKEKVNKYLNEIKNFSEEDIVYIDETGIQGYIYREYARAIRGKKVYDKIPGKKYKRTNIVAGKCGDKIISPLVYDKIMDSKFFEKWFKEMFLNEVEKNKAIVMDNATFHCKSRLYELCKNANKNLKLIFLPPYSPNLNPIEKYWATLKKNLKKIIKELAQNPDVTVLVSSHDLLHTVEVCDRIVALNKGEVVKDIQTSAETLQELEMFFAV